MSALMPIYKRLPVSFVRGAGAHLYDREGRRYLDGLSGIAVTNLGHCHENVVQAIQQQAATLMHTSNLFEIERQEQLAGALAAATGFEKLFFCNSGAEANEAAIKLARHYGTDRGVKQPTIVVLETAFHGRTMGALAASAGRGMQDPFAPMLPGFIRVPVGDLAAIEAEAAKTLDIVAVLVEPVQGEGGVRPLPVEYLQALRALCDEREWLLMFDEVQCGNGRCGALYAFQRLGVTPDVMTTAKGLGNGFPIGACMARGRAAEVMTAGDHGTTYGGNPLGCAAANAVLQTLTDGALYTRADTLRDRLLGAFNERLEDPGRVRDIRGLGLMIGIEVTVPADTLVARGLESGVIINVTAGNTVRLLPPLTLSEEDAGALGRTVADLINATPETAP